MCGGDVYACVSIRLKLLQNERNDKNDHNNDKNTKL